jgi:hypothetical protein
MIIPEAALAQHLAILGKTGSGKTFTAKGIIEYLLDRERHVGIIDPTDAWWGLRSSMDGKGAGFPILVLGGEHGDLPLPALGGAAVARLLVEQGVNLIASTKHLTVGERTRWFIDFASTISRLNRAPLHLVIDEAHNFAPQGKVPDPETGKMLHAANTLASGGRGIGVRLLMITQRPQKLHKDTLTSADTLIAMRMLAPHDRAAVEEWIKGCGDMAQGKEVLNTLAGLKKGEGWAWYPEGGFLERLKFPMIKTFDSSATPEDGHTLAAPKRTAEIDLTEVNKALADAVKEAEANDPRILRKRIVELELAAARKGLGAVVDQATKAELAAEYRRGHEEGHEAGMSEMWHQVRTGHERVRQLLVEFDSAIGGQVSTFTRKLSDELESPQQPSQPARQQPPPPRASPPPRPVAQPSRRSPAQPQGLQQPMPRAMLTTLAQHQDGLTKAQILVHTGYRSSGAVSRCFAELVRNGWVEPFAFAGRVDSLLRITMDGIKVLGPWDPLPVGADLRAHLLNGSKLSQMEKKILRLLFDSYPDALAKGKALEATGYASSGATSRAFARLVALGYARPMGHGHLAAGEDFFK